MLQSSNYLDNSERVLKRTQIEALKSISQLLVQEIAFLGKIQSNLTDQVSSGNRISLNEELQKFELDLIRCALIRTMGKQNEAAKLLGLKNSTLNEKIKRYGINVFDLAV